MGIVTWQRDNITDLWCEGCGAHHRLHSCAWRDILERLTQLGWITVPYDYGYGLGFEHFCSVDCCDEDESD